MISINSLIKLADQAIQSPDIVGDDPYAGGITNLAKLNQAANPATVRQLCEALQKAMERLELISEDQSYVESQSTGIKYYHKTVASEIADKALQELREVIND